MPKKGQRYRTHCVFEGCAKAVYHYPKGQVSKFCAEHAHLGHMSKRQKDTLKRLAAAKADGWAFIDLDDVHPKTREALRQDDLIFESAGVDGSIKYTITGRGEKALEALSASAYRFDGLCPSCGKRPVKISKSGHRSSYCEDCGSEQRKPFNDAYRFRQPTRGCTRCGADRHQFESGAYSTLCTLHYHEWMHEQYAKNQEKARAKIAEGEAILCVNCKVNPVLVYEDSIGFQCAECKRASERKRRKKKELNRTIQRLRIKIERRE